MSGRCSRSAQHTAILAIFAHQTHVQRHTELEEDTCLSVERYFYVDNCLQSVQSQEQTKQLVNHLCTLLMEGGFELREWASNVPAVIQHLLKDFCSENSTHWFTVTQQTNSRPAGAHTWTLVAVQVRHTVL